MVFASSVNGAMVVLLELYTTASNLRHQAKLEVVSGHRLYSVHTQNQD